MTLSKFQRLLKKIDPRLRIRHRGASDIEGVFVGLSAKGSYICRMTKGEFHLNGYRTAVVDPNNKMQLINGNIKKRGRKTVVMLLRSRGWIKNHREVSMLSWGIERNDVSHKSRKVLLYG